MRFGFEARRDHSGSRPVRHLRCGRGSTNPITDYHLIYGVVLVVLAASHAGHTWGLGRIWARLPFVQRNRWMI